MKTRSALLYTVCICVACLLYACSGVPGYGVLGPTGGSSDVGIADLNAGWEDYDIYYNTWYTATPSAIMFDPRDNDTTLTGKSWTKVTEQADFFELFNKVARSHELTQVWAIVGPEQQLLGYMITPTTQLYIKNVDENTYYVSNLRAPPSGP